MDTIAIDTAKQAKVHKKVTKLKERIKEGVEDKRILKKKQKALEKLRQRERKRGVVYLGHIPHGFYEDAIFSYSRQFGAVSRVRVARSNKTGRSKGYAFVEFYSPDVAKIFADTINNYLMFDRLLVCQYIEPEKRHYKMFWTGSDSFRTNAKQIKDTQAKNKNSSPSKDDRKNRRKIEDFKTFFEQRGIEFNFKVNDPGCQVTSKSNEGIPEAILEIDESDDEVEFNAPPNVTKVFKSDKAKRLTLTLRQSNILNTKNAAMAKLAVKKGAKKDTKKVIPVKTTKIVSQKSKGKKVKTLSKK